MSTEITIEDKRSAMMVPGDPQPPASLMTVIGNLAANPNVDVDKIQKLLEIQERWEMNRAKAEFREAMAVFKQSPPTIRKDRHVEYKRKDGGIVAYDHATLGNVTEQICAGLGKVGITHGFRTSQQGPMITVTCILSKGVYSEETTLCGGADDSGSKNAVQAIGSTVTYLQRYTLLAATGLATEDQDTDGATAPIIQIMPDPELLEWIDSINQSPDDKELARLVRVAREAAAKYDCQVSYLAIDRAAILASHSLKTLLQVFPKMYAKWEGKQNFKAARELGEAFEKRKAELEGQS
jgi:hypothetical protein